MARLYVEVPKTVAKIAQHFGDALGIAVFDNSVDGRLPEDSTIQDALKAAGAYTIAEAEEAMQDELDKLRDAGEVSPSIYDKFRGSGNSNDSARGSEP